jgi:hypothetical protein
MGDGRLPPWKRRGRKFKYSRRKSGCFLQMHGTVCIDIQSLELYIGILCSSQSTTILLLGGIKTKVIDQTILPLTKHQHEAERNRLLLQLIAPVEKFINVQKSPNAIPQTTTISLDLLLAVSLECRDGGKGR